MQMMDFKDGIRLSRLGMGNMRLPIIDNNHSCINYDSAKKIIDTCMKDGVNYYDTAYVYHGGESEGFISKALSEYPRDSYYIADKYNYQANPDYKAQFAIQLKRLNSEYIDFYLLHGVQNEFAKSMLTNGCIEYFDEMKKCGKIHYFGFSFHGNTDLLRRMIEMYKWDFVQLQINYYDWFFGDSEEFYNIVREAGIPVIVMEPVHGGLLASKDTKIADVLQPFSPECSIASWAMRFLIGLDGVQTVLSGMSDISQAEDNIKTFSDAKPLSEEEIKLVKKAAEEFRADVGVSCTACRYCCDTCPAKLDIPTILKAYNDAKIGGRWRLGPVDAMPEDRKPFACIGCGVCTEHCPQSIDVPKYMDEIKEMLK